MSPGWLPFALALLCTDHVPEPHVTPAAVASSAATVAWTIEVVDHSGTPLQVRARVKAVGGPLYPIGRDTTLLSHLGAGGHFYIDGSATLQVPAGDYDVMIGRGFEWKARSISVSIARDTVTRHILTRSFDLRPLGWYSGDVHSHAKHPPLEYPIGPTEALRVARAEGLSVTHLLDQSDDFTGAPHPISDSEHLLYMSYEHRNQTYGHVVLPGLQQPVTEECCLTPQAPYPTLLDLSREVRAQGDGLVVLAHPRTTDAYAPASGWPGAGLGRELPVLLAHGALDAMDVVSYSNAPDTLWSEWYDALEAGFHLPPSAGTDAVLNWYNHAPPGGWRVYADLGDGQPLDYDAWLAAVRRGHAFVTGYPLIPSFEVNGVVPGDTLDVNRDTVTVQVHWNARCAIELADIRVIANGECVFARPTPSRPTVHDTTITVRVATPGWLALRVLGVQGFIHTAPAIPVAHTAAVWLQRDGVSRRSTAASARWQDQLDTLSTYLEARDGWSAAWQRDTVEARIALARAVYGSAFVVPPTAFAWLEPAADGAAAAQLVWTSATDPEPGDRVRYRVRITRANDAAVVVDTLTSLTQFSTWALTPGEAYVASVHAQDRSGQGPLAGGTPRAFVHVALPLLSAPPAAPVRVRAWPNPSRGALAIEGLGDDTEVLDLSGRRVAWLGAGVSRDGAMLHWTHAHDRAPLAPGVYLVRSRSQARTLRVVRLDR